ncbi:MAG: response regulator [Chloroflexi bacterium]|nr:response regulator [Chloroflexota bacterium]
MSVRIVVADDEADIRRLIAFTLRRRGYLVLEASSGDAALELIRAERPDLVVLDVMMPGLTGLEVAQALALDPTTAGIPVVMLSARGQVTEVEAGIASGARTYLVKPFIPQELAARIADILATRSQGTEA